MAELKNRSDCPISCSLDIWGDKWSLLIIRDLMMKKKCTYGDFMKSSEKIATNILATRLALLEENNIIKKSTHPESKAKVLYTLTRKGAGLVPVIVEIQLWAENYFPLSGEVKTMLRVIKKDKAGYIKTKKKELEKQ